MIQGPAVTARLSLFLVPVFAPRVFLRVLWFFSKTNTLKFEFDQEIVNELHTVETGKNVPHGPLGSDADFYFEKEWV